MDPFAQPTDTELVEAPAEARAMSRRRALGLGGLMSSLAVAREAEAQSRRKAPTPTAIARASIELKLARRITYGLTPVEISIARGLGFESYLDYHLNYAAIDDSFINSLLSTQYTTLDMPSVVLRTLPDRSVASKQLQDASFLRALFSNRQLYERMVEFWTDHFNIDIPDATILKTPDDKYVARVHALGTFPGILVASATSPAMQHYLDNVNSLKRSPNQNYARELMELHTLGVNGGYTQQDIVDVARCFTGWGYVYSTSSPSYGLFTYLPSNHDNGSKMVLGNFIPANGGINDGYTVLNILAYHPSTARFITSKIACWLLRYDPRDADLDYFASVYQSTGGDIKTIIRAILTRRNVEDEALLYKRPLDLIVSALRALGVVPTNLTALQSWLSQMGQAPYSWSPPNGYPHSLEYWVGLILPRWNYAFALANNSVSGAPVDVAGLMAGATTPQAVADRIDAMLTGGEMPALEKAGLVGYLSAGTLNLTRMRDALGLALSSPSYQWR